MWLVALSSVVQYYDVAV